MASVKINITVQDELLSRIDAYADDNGMTRSGLLQMAARQYLDAVEMSPAVRSMMRNLSDLAQAVVDGKLPPAAVNDALTDLDAEYGHLKSQAVIDGFPVQ